MSTDMEKLNIILAVRNREFDRAMERSTNRIARFEQKSKKSLSRTTRHFDAVGFAARRLGPLLAALSAGAVIGKLKRTVAALDDIGKTADKLGLTTDALQELRAVAESAGIAQGSLDSSMERFSKRIGEATLGTGAANKALKEMGLSASALARMGLDEALSVVADRMADIPDPTERAARAAALFGREGVAMVNLLREGSIGMAKMRAEARDLGIVIDEKLIRNAEEAQTKLDLMSRVIGSQLSQTLINLAPLLVGAAEGIADISRAVNSLLSLSYNQPELMNAGQLREYAAGFSNVRTELQAMTQAQAAYNSNLEKFGEGSAEAERWLMRLEDARGNLATAVTEQKVKEDALSEASGGIEDMAAARDAALERARLAGISADAAERERISKEKTAYVEQIMASAARGGEPVSDTQLEGILLLADQFEAAEIAASKILNPLERAGGGAARAAEQARGFEAVLARIFSLTGDTANETEGYAEILSRVQTLFEEGEIDGDLYADMISDIKDQFRDAIDAAENMERATEQMFIGIIDGSKSAKEAVADLLKQFASMALNSAVKGMFGGLFDGVSGFFSSPVTGYSKGGYTGSGGRMTPAGVVHKGEYVFDQAATRRIGVGNLQALQTGAPSAMGGNARQSMGGGSVVINQHFSIAANGDDGVLRIIQGEMPRIADVTTAAVLDATRRRPSGGAY